MKTQTYLVKYQKYKGGNRRKLEITVLVQSGSTKTTILADIAEKIANIGLKVDPDNIIIMDTKLIKEENI